MVHPVTEAELILFSDMSYAPNTLRKELASLHFNLEVPVEIVTDGETLLDVISNGTPATEKCLMIDVVCGCEGFSK